MTRPVLAASLLTLWCAVHTGKQAHAGPVPPCVTSTLSANGNILVVNELTLEEPDKNQGRRWKQSTYHVRRRYTEPNFNLRLNGPDPMWSGDLWDVVSVHGLGQPVLACDPMLITNDGEFLVFVHGIPSLSIYRRGQEADWSHGGAHHGVLVREISGKVLFPPPPGTPYREMFSDDRPRWFAGGDFAFSRDNQTLLYFDRSGGIVRIHLATGALAHRASKR